jgi:hypothetical protein
MVYYTDKEKLKIVMDMVYKLRYYKNPRGESVNLMNERFTFVNKLKEIMNKYVKEDNSEYKGYLYFEEIGKRIKYFFPAKTLNEPMLAILQNE